MKVTIDGMAWLDASAMTEDQRRNLMGKLTVYPRAATGFGKAQPEPIYLYEDREEMGLIGIPRGFYAANKKGSHEEVVDVSDGEPMSEDVESSMSFDGPFAEQAKALTVMEAAFEGKEFGGIILKAGCGFGKTNAALEFAYRLGRKTLILVHKEFFLRQWKERIEQFLPGARVGFIRQDQCEFENVDFAIALVQSLAKDGDGDRYPQDIYDAFGLVITDEVHRFGAATWAPVMPRFKARWRLGLTATPRRKDDAEDVFFHHIGPIAYSARTQPLVPKVRRLFTDTQLTPIVRGREVIDAGKIGPALVTSQLAADKFRTRQIVEDMAHAVKRGRKLLVVSERLEHLRSMASELNAVLSTMEIEFPPVCDFYTGEWFTGEVDGSGKPKKRTRTEEDLRKAEKANVIFATKQMVEEGLDIPALDVLVLATPMGDVEQAAGRVRRHCKPSEDKCKHLCPWRAGICPEKPLPIVVDVVDENVSQVAGKTKSRKRFYKSIGAG